VCASAGGSVDGGEGDVTRNTTGNVHDSIIRLYVL
jgi:hypothetical protein